MFRLRRLRRPVATATSLPRRADLIDYHVAMGWRALTLGILWLVTGSVVVPVVQLSRVMHSLVAMAFVFGIITSIWDYAHHRRWAARYREVA